MGFGGSVFQWHRDLRLSLAYAPTRLAWYDPRNLRGAELQDVAARCARRMQQEEGKGGMKREILATA